jgi:hypothetical protein
MIAQSGGERGWLSCEVEAEIGRLLLYAPRGLGLHGITWLQGLDGRYRWSVCLSAPGHPRSPSLVVRFEFDKDATRDEVAMRFHVACQRWLELVA